MGKEEVVINMCLIIFVFIAVGEQSNHSQLHLPLRSCALQHNQQIRCRGNRSGCGIASRCAENLHRERGLRLRMHLRQPRQVLELGRAVEGL
mgnify:CR=1 FL=1